jgi:hypothetical protein
MYQKNSCKRNDIIDQNGEVAIIKVTHLNGTVTEFKIDTEYIPLVERFKWFCHMGYCSRMRNNRDWPLSWQLFGKPPKGCLYRHLNENRRDCRKSNLRMVTWSVNNLLKKGRENRTTQRRGVSRYANGSFVAIIGVANKRKSFKTLEEAVEARERFEAAMEVGMPHLKPREVASNQLHSQKMLNRTSALDKRGDGAMVRE